VLPIALAHGDVLGLSGTGWTYMLILSLTSGIVAQGLLVYAQKTIQIGTIGIAQVAQPALAVVWSYLVLGEVVGDRQAAGIAIVMGGLAGFTLLNQRGDRSGRAP
jgi:drug/metabolite transporter (DMT)-like permease